MYANNMPENELILELTPEVIFVEDFEGLTVSNKVQNMLSSFHVHDKKIVDLNGKCKLQFRTYIQRVQKKLNAKFKTKMNCDGTITVLRTK